MSSDGIERGADAPQGADEVGETFERKVLAVQRDHHRVGGHEGIERQETERGWAVDEDVVVVVAYHAEQKAKALFALRVAAPSRFPRR